MRSYEAARGLFSFMAFVAWVIMLGGVAIAIGGGVIVGNLYAYRSDPELEVLLACLPGIGVSLVGLFILALAQIGRAGVDTAEYSQQMLQLSRDSLEVSRQSLRQGEQLKNSFDALKTAAPKEPLASFADLRTGSTDRKPEVQPAPAPSVGYGNRSSEAAVSTAMGTLELRATTPDFGSASPNGSTEKAKST